MNNIVFLQKHFDILKKHLFPGDGKEAMAVCLARQIKKDGRIKFIVIDIYPIPHEKCERSEDYITWATADIVDILDKAEADKLSVIKVHSHPYGPRAFSAQDNRSDMTLFPSLQNWCGDTNYHCSLVLTEDFIVGRYFDHKFKKFAFIDNIFVIGDRLQLFSRKSVSKIECAFDDLTYEIMIGLKIGVVGISGTGSWTAEMLGRNGVGKVVLCEYDFLTKSNLPRVLNSKLKHVGKNKAVVAAEAIADMAMGTVVELVTVPLQTRTAIEALKDCDIIIGCVDSVFARHLLNVLCTYYVIPYFDIGVSINANSTELLTAAGGFHYIQPGKSSLMTREVFSAKDLADDTFQTFSGDYYNELKAEGYVNGRNASRPAVVGLNNQAVSLCFNEIESQLLNYLYPDEVGVASMVFCKRSRELYCKYEHQFKADEILLKKLGLCDQFLEVETLLLEQSELEI